MSKWISVNEKLPSDEKNVLVCCEVWSNRKLRYVCEAYHINKFSVEWDPSWDENIDCDYNEDDDTGYIPEGWYEVIHNWGEYGSVKIQDNVTHWMSIPRLPKEE